MASSWTLDDIARALDLIAAPFALEVLDGLGHGVAPREVAPAGTDPGVIEDAVEHLRQVGAVAISGDNFDMYSYVLTPNGLRLIAAFETIGATERA